MAQPRIRLVSMALLFAAAAPGVAHALPLADNHVCIGRWVGTGRNTGSPTSWTIDLTLSAAPSGGRCGTIEYTNPTCGGTLEACTVVGGDIHTREAYSHTEGHCAPAGTVIIRCEGDTMRYSWIGWERVDSVLHRAGGSPSPTPSPRPGVTPPSPTVPTPSVPGVTPTPAPSPSQTPAPGPNLPRVPTPLPPAQPPSGGGGLCAIAHASADALVTSTFVAGLVVLGVRRRRRRRFARAYASTP